MPGFIDSTIGQWLCKMAADYPDNDGLIYPELRLTYKELNEECRKVAKGLLALGVKKGDHVAIWAPNVPQWLLIAYGCAKIGAWFATVNTNYKIFELEYLMRQSDSMTLFFSDGIKGSDYHAILRDLLSDRSRIPLLKNIIHLPKADSPKPDEGISEWEDFIKGGENISDEELDKIEREQDPHDVINMQYTSGTTGFPKGVMLTHFNILNNGFFIGECMKLTPEDRLCIPVPFFHCFGLVLASMACITHASAMIPIEVYSPLSVLQTVERERCTALHGVPTMFIFVLDHPDFEKYDLSTLRTGIMAGSPCPIEVMRRVVEQMNMRDIVITYGQTESSPGITMSRTDDPLELRVATVGKLLPNCEAKIVNPETNETVPPGEQGEICTRGYHLMRGYYNMPEATAAAIDADGWLHTGDLGVCDENGYYSITGRIRDMIIRGGENIYPREIEELIYTHPEVADVQVVAVPSKKFGEEVCAVIIKRGETDEEDIKNYVRERMSRHKVPSYVIFTESFPMNAAGKILKYKLREDAAKELGL